MTEICTANGKTGGVKTEKDAGLPGRGGKGRDRPCRGAGKEEMEKRKGTGGAGLPYAMPIQLFGIGHTVFATVRPPKPDRTHTPEFNIAGFRESEQKDRTKKQAGDLIREIPGLSDHSCLQECAAYPP